jgi:hypothetical protein
MSHANEAANYEKPSHYALPQFIERITKVVLAKRLEITDLEAFSR